MKHLASTPCGKKVPFAVNVYDENGRIETGIVRKEYVVLVVHVCLQYAIFTYNDHNWMVHVEALSEINKQSVRIQKQKIFC